MSGSIDEIFAVHAPDYVSDGQQIAVNGMAYGREFAGFHDWLEKGVAEPVDPTTVFVELRSVKVPSVLWAIAGWTSTPPRFLVTERTRSILEANSIKGIDWTPVQIVKIATRGKRQHRSGRGEPEDQLLKAKNLIAEVGPLPVFWGLRVNAMTEVMLGSSDRSATLRLLQPYEFCDEPQADIWIAALNGKRYGGQVFCGRRLRHLCATTASET